MKCVCATEIKTNQSLSFSFIWSKITEFSDIAGRPEKDIRSLMGRRVYLLIILTCFFVFKITTVIQMRFYKQINMHLAHKTFVELPYRYVIDRFKLDVRLLATNFVCLVDGLWLVDASLTAQNFTQAHIILRYPQKEWTKTILNYM